MSEIKVLNKNGIDSDRIMNSLHEWLTDLFDDSWPRIEAEQAHLRTKAVFMAWSAAVNCRDQDFVEHDIVVAIHNVYFCDTRSGRAYQEEYCPDPADYQDGKDDKSEPLSLEEIKQFRLRSFIVELKSIVIITPDTVDKIFAIEGEDLYTIQQKAWQVFFESEQAKKFIEDNQSLKSLLEKYSKSY